MVKSHRSSSTIFHQWPSIDTHPIQTPNKKSPAIAVVPGSPSLGDPFGSQIDLPSVVSRPTSIVSNSSVAQTSSNSATTPRIVLASPSTSTIHYLFPSSDTRSHLSPNPVQRSSSTGTSIKRSSGQDGKRGTIGRGNASNILSPSRRIVSPSGNPQPGQIDSVKPKTLPTRQSVPSMRTLRRQPSIADLGGRGKVHALKIEVDGVRVEDDRKGPMRSRESLVLREMENRRDYLTGGPIRAFATEISPKNTTFLDRDPSPPYIAPPSPNPDKALRRRSQSLTASPRRSPVLPAPDFGDPILMSDFVPSPSFSHLDYSTAGSSPISRRGSVTTSTFSRHNPTAVFPVAGGVAMSRGDTRIGLGGYSSGKMKAREDAAKRLNGEIGPGPGKSSDSGLERKSSLRRSISLKWKGDGEDRKSRGRSHSLSARSVRDLYISEPVPMPASPRSSDTEKRPLGRGIHLGDPSIDLGGRYASFSPSETAASSTPSSLGVLEEVRIGRPYPALARGSEISILAPSSIGLGYSPISIAASLPESLEAEAIDLTQMEIGTKGFLNRTIQPYEASPLLSAMSSGTASSSLPSPKEEPCRGPRRSLLLTQNTFFIPPTHPRPALRSSRSMGSSMRSYGSPFPIDASPSSTQPPRIPATGTPSTRTSRARRPVTGFFCSPPNAIEPLPHVSPNPEISQSRKLRSNKSSPFLSASASLRMVISKEGFVGRSLSHAFDKEGKDEKDELKSRISSPLGTAREEERAWRESLLERAVSLSISSRLNALAESEEKGVNGSKPKHGMTRGLLESALPSEELKEAETGDSIGQAMLKSPISLESGLNLKFNGMERFVVPAEAPPVPERSIGKVGREDSGFSASVYSNIASTRESPKIAQKDRMFLTSRWSPNPGTRRKKERPIISDPVPINPAAKSPLPIPPEPTLAMTKLPSSRSRFFTLISPTVRTSVLSPLLTLHPKARKSKSRLLSDPKMHPVSSSDLPEPRSASILDELDPGYEMDKEVRKEERKRKVEEWRHGVGEDDDKEFMQVEC